MMSPHPRNLKTKPVSYSMWPIALAARVSSLQPRSSLPHPALLIGDAKNCALLKDAAIEIFAVYLESVMSSPGWANIRESVVLLAEVMKVLANRKKRSAPVASNEQRN
jgi:hypothetical protein